ncbi:hypothetical protein CWI42_020520 [Ordospora colligata]|uniref:XPG-I domain-containing protein n=1 Tax=Ordospora colligata OC4 TaxID=1354746 RepID=A0A0B2UME7_9MICR|nr:uncharacterized protein M896_020530 [Ordospora colligata OC4]KHN70217.1 hypothetical protein M896_020530 [Ordospora colligata OC4]TBU16761.1 hypothetical protein CWI41_020540 [Ordospora colligata]TBU17067.1 hypothetical protein CWI40_020540 [Ordospora colligata]TBU19310.1 hypothetical protein CWI42_020520 [Ordospora colligata]
MSIRGLDDMKMYPKQNFLMKIPHKAFEKMRICMDGNWFLRKYTGTMKIHEGFVMGMDEIVLECLAPLFEFKKEYDIDIIWVWDGIRLQKPQIVEQSGSDTQMQHAFDLYRQGEYKRAGRAWGGLAEMGYNTDMINKVLGENGVFPVTAPYSATAQCAYFISIGACSYAFGKSDILLFEEVEKVILDMFGTSTTEGCFNVLYKSKFVEFFGLGLKQFLITGLLLGCDFCSTLPSYAEDFSVAKVVDAVKESDDPMQMIRKLCEDSVCKKYTEHFLQGVATVTYHPVMKITGEVQPYNQDNVPKGLEKIFGTRLAPRVYEAMFMNEVSGDAPQILGMKNEDADLISMTEEIMARMESMKQSKGFADIICPKMVICNGLSEYSALLLLEMIILGRMRSPYVPKILCLYDGQMYGGGCSSQKMEISRSELLSCLRIDYEMLKYYAELLKVFSLLKSMKEMGEKMYGMKAQKQSLKKPILLNALFHGSFEFNGEMGKSNFEFLRRVKVFLEANRGVDEKVSEALVEVEEVLKQ